MDAIKEGMLASAKAAEAAARIGERLFAKTHQSVMNFKSQICTDKNQSERLLSLGLKKETADMCWIPLNDGRCVLGVSTEIRLDTIPAWSLHRLAFLLDASPYPIYLDSNAYNDIIDDIEELINHNEFNKAYLV